jgi:hypothetical protein
MAERSGRDQGGAYAQQGGGAGGEGGAAPEAGCARDLVAGDVAYYQKLGNAHVIGRRGLK